MKNLMKIALPFSLLMAGAATTALQAKGYSEETRSAETFDTIAVNGSIDVFAKVGEKASIKVVADDDIISKVITKMRGDTLVVELENGNYNNIKRMDVYVTTPKLSAVKLNGSGDVEIENLQSDNFLANLRGSGDIIIDDAKVENFEVNLKGSGDIEIDGQCDEIAINLRGSGDIEAGSLKCKTANIELMGSGDIIAYAGNEVNASLRGSGDIVIKGNPDKVRQSVHGSGDIVVK